LNKKDAKKDERDNEEGPHEFGILVEALSSTP